jgi:anti-anti-sigma factor
VADDPGANVTQSRTAVTRQDGVTVLSLFGEHDGGTAAALRIAAHETVAEGHPFVFDLRAAEFVDSEILAVLFSTQRRCRQQGVGFGMILSADQANPVRCLIQVVGVAAALSATTDLETAIAAARG